MHLVLNMVQEQPLTAFMVKDFLQTCPKAIEMNIIIDPMVAHTDDYITGVVVIAESHISVHATKDCTNVDVFSCKSFDFDKAKKCAENILLAKTKQAFLIPRLTVTNPFLSFPDEIKL